MNANVLIRRIFLTLLMGLMVASGLAMASSDNGTLKVGSHSINCGSGEANFYGFSSITDLGSYSPTGLTGGTTVVELYDSEPTGIACGSTFSVFEVSGFSSDPGSNWLTSVECNGFTLESSSASYSYGSGYALWQWSSVFGFYSKVGSNVTCTIVHS